MTVKMNAPTWLKMVVKNENSSGIYVSRFLRLPPDVPSHSSLVNHNTLLPHH